MIFVYICHGQSIKFEYFLQFLGILYNGLRILSSIDNIIFNRKVHNIVKIPEPD